jgi:hypothetical protein
VPVPGRAGPAGDRMLTAVQGEQHWRCFSLLDFFLRSDAEDCPTYVAPTSFVCDGDGATTGPLCADRSLGETAPGGRVCAFESVRGRRQRVRQYDRGAAASAPFARRMAGRCAHEGSREVQPRKSRNVWVDWLYPFWKRRTRRGRNTEQGRGATTPVVLPPLAPSFVRCLDAD